MLTNIYLVAMNVNTLDSGSHKMGSDHCKRMWKPLPISNLPKMVLQVRIFVGLVNYYQDMFLQHTHILTPLTNLTA